MSKLAIAFLAFLACAAVASTVNAQTPKTEPDPAVSSTGWSGINKTIKESIGAVSALVVLIGTAVATFRKVMTPRANIHDQIKRNLELLKLLPKDEFPDERDKLNGSIKQLMNDFLAPPPPPPEHRDVGGALLCWVWCFVTLVAAVWVIWYFGQSWWSWVIALALAWWGVISIAVGYDSWTGNQKFHSAATKKDTQTVT